MLPHEESPSWNHKPVQCGEKVSATPDRNKHLQSFMYLFDSYCRLYLIIVLFDAKHFGQLLVAVRCYINKY